LQSNDRYAEAGVPQLRSGHSKREKYSLILARLHVR
jgi:hypothetical protein